MWEIVDGKSDDDEDDDITMTDKVTLTQSLYYDDDISMLNDTAPLTGVDEDQPIQYPTAQVLREMYGDPKKQSNNIIHDSNHPTLMISISRLELLSIIAHKFNWIVTSAKSALTFDAAPPITDEMTQRQWSTAAQTEYDRLEEELNAVREEQISDEDSEMAHSTDAASPLELFEFDVNRTFRPDSLIIGVIDDEAHDIYTHHDPQLREVVTQCLKKNKLLF